MENAATGNSVGLVKCCSRKDSRFGRCEVQKLTNSFTSSNEDEVSKQYFLRLRSAWFAVDFVVVFVFVNKPRRVPRFYKTLQPGFKANFQYSTISVQ